MRLDDLLGAGFALIGIGIDPRTVIDEIDLATWRRLDTRFATLHAFGGRPQGEQVRGRAGMPIVIEDVGGELLAWLRAHGHGPGSVVILRPDRYVYGAVGAGELSAATKRLQHELAPHGLEHASHAMNGRLDPEAAS
jgi:3-(3-hydroxy-phenyl)propionate hydroxylase